MSLQMLILTSTGPQIYLVSFIEDLDGWIQVHTFVIYDICLCDFGRKFQLQCWWFWQISLLHYLCSFVSSCLIVLIKIDFLSLVSSFIKFCTSLINSLDLDAVTCNRNLSTFIISIKRLGTIWMVCRHYWLALVIGPHFQFPIVIIFCFKLIWKSWNRRYGFSFLIWSSAYLEHKAHIAASSYIFIDKIFFFSKLEF